MSDTDVTVVGGGIAGLTAAWNLKRKGINVTLLEEEEAAGGNIKTLEHEGYRLEIGPHNFMGAAEHVWKVVKGLDYYEMIEEAAGIARNRYIFRDGKLFPLPLGFTAFIKTGLLSPKAKLRLMMEPFIPNGAKEKDTAWEFFCRRFGKEAATYIMSPFVSGIYAGDVKTLGARTAFPKFWNFEKTAGSMILGAGLYLYRKKKRLAREGLKTRKGLFSFQNGLGTLTSRLFEELKENALTGISVKSIISENGKLTIKADRYEKNASAVILAVPPNRLSKILEEPLPETVEKLNAVPMSPVALVHWSIPLNEEQTVPEGFGLLVPKINNMRILGTLFPSQLFRNRAPEGYALMASFYGGMLDQKAVDLSDEELASLVKKEHEVMFGHTLNGVKILKVLRYRHAIPQLLPDHDEKIDFIMSRISKVPGVFLAGNYLTGVGVEHAAASGFKAAKECLDFLSGNDE